MNYSKTKFYQPLNPKSIPRNHHDSITSVSKSLIDSRDRPIDISCSFEQLNDGIIVEMIGQDLCFEKIDRLRVKRLEVEKCEFGVVWFLGGSIGLTRRWE